MVVSLEVGLRNMLISNFAGFLVINKSNYLMRPLFSVVGSSLMLLWIPFVYCSMDS